MNFGQQAREEEEREKSVQQKIHNVVSRALLRASRAKETLALSKLREFSKVASHDESAEAARVANEKSRLEQLKRALLNKIIAKAGHAKLASAYDRLVGFGRAETERIHGINQRE